MRRRDVEAVTGLPTSTLYLKMKRGEFPRPVKIGKQAVRWPASRVQAWIDEQINRG